MQILENLLPRAYLNDLTTLFFSNEFPWFYSAQTSKYIGDGRGEGVILNKNVVETPQFTHTFYYNQDRKTSVYYEVMNPLFVIIQKELQLDLKLVRIKANLLLQQPDYPDGCYHTRHIDWNQDGRDISLTNHRSVVYYVNDSDGDTVLFNECLQDNPKELTVKHRQTPKANTAIYFNSDNYHASMSPKNTKARLVINFVMIEE
jgi:Rps23 Pro-64 3,4-dihydroxylase Tpa1-like proline 4-hydroxylase